MKYLFFYLLFLLNFTKISAQLDVKVAEEVCDSLKTIKAIDSTQLYVEQMTLKVDLLTKTFKNLPKETLQKERNILNFMNVFNYKVDRYLQLNCEVNILTDPFQFRPLTSVVDFNDVFTYEQFRLLESQINKISVDKSLDILVLEVDDFYPSEDITTYSFEILNNWSSGLRAEKGKIIIVFSKELRQIRISTDVIAQRFIEDEFLQNIIDQTIVPKFKEGNYYQGILDTLYQIEKKL